MSKKLICLLLTLILCLTATALAEETENPMDKTGYWLDSWSRRAHMTITFDGEQHRAVVHWSGSAFESVQWEMTGLFEHGRLASDNCHKTSHFFSEDGSEEVILHYENEHAELTLTDGAILLTDPEGICADCRFERYDEIDLEDVFNPGHYAHLYVTNAVTTNGTLCVTGVPGTIHENGESSGFEPKDRLMLPISADCVIRLADESSDLSAQFSGSEENAGFYAVFRLNEKGEITRLLYNEDQPDAPLMTSETNLEKSKQEVMVVPAPPSGR